MKPNILLTSLLSSVIFYNAVISGRILHGSDKGTLRSYSGSIGKKYGHPKTGDKITSKRTSRKLPAAGSLLRWGDFILSLMFYDLKIFID